MYREDFTNWTPEKCKQKIHEFQKSGDAQLFSVLLAKYDKYLVKLAWGYKKRLREIELQDIYHSSIIGFGEAIDRFKLNAPSKLIIAVIKAYVRREIESRYISKKTETPNEDGVTGFDAKMLHREDLIDIYFIVNSAHVSDIERELICLRYEDNLSIQEIGERFGMSRQLVSKKLEKVLVRIRKKIAEDGK